MKDIRYGSFDPAVRNAEKESARAEDAHRVESGALTREQLARRNAFIPYSIDLSRWKMIHDSIVEGDDELP